MLSWQILLTNGNVIAAACILQLSLIVALATPVHTPVEPPERDAKGRFVLTLNTDVVIPIRRDNGTVIGEMPIAMGSKIAFLREENGQIVALYSNRKVSIPTGKTNYKEAAEGTIRKMYATSIQENCVHGSDSLNSVLREISFFFSELEIFSNI